MACPCEASHLCTEPSLGVMQLQLIVSEERSWEVYSPAGCGHWRAMPVLEQNAARGLGKQARVLQTHFSQFQTDENEEVVEFVGRFIL